ncbi:hypothetical protein [Kitasatospora sp. NPDC096140]|uniref:hypothetical protein n=1 Tax=Kitasatospora sp. NPDC096140 TaxID=3155425 RepID=UPI003319B00D
MLVLHHAFDRRRKGRDEAYAALDELLSAWIGEARAVVAQHGGAPRRLVAVKVPLRPKYTDSCRTRDSMTQWEAAVLAMYQVAADWQTGTVALLVPHLVAEHLLVGSTGSMCAEALKKSGLPVEAPLARWAPGKADKR